ncbi:hypothetical protein GCM10023196_013360 [Actinoallomurus vinaceus]|uniref:Uncharacterized protein n=1 Tax=Actinoallomurus vinaceus TaxID=1080074 RepID=A0ABP8U2S4_9ACTN
MRTAMTRALVILAVGVIVITGFAAWNPLKYVYLQPVGTAFPVLPVGVALLLAAPALRSASRQGHSDLRKTLAPAGVIVGIVLLVISLLYIVVTREPARTVGRVVSPDHRYTVLIREDVADGSFLHTVAVLRTTDGLLSRQTPVLFSCPNGWSYSTPDIRFAGPNIIDLRYPNGDVRQATLDRTSFTVHPVTRLGCDHGP